MRPQEDLPAHVERVLHVARGVVLRDVEGLEVVVVELDLGPLGDGEPHPGEHVHDLVVHLGERVEPARDDAAARERQVGPVGRQPGSPLDALQDGLPGLELRLDPRLRLVRLAPHERPLGGRQSRQGAQELGEAPALAEVLDPDLVEVPASGGPLDLLAGALDDRADALVGHGGTRGSFYRMAMRDRSAGQIQRAGLQNAADRCATRNLSATSRARRSLRELSAPSRPLPGRRHPATRVSSRGGDPSHFRRRQTRGPTDAASPAMLDLTALARPFRYRVVPDAEGLPVIPGRLGQIEPHDAQALAVYSARPRVFARLWAVPEVRPWQVGDQEMRALFPVAALPAVAGLIRARTRRTLSAETARQKGAGTAYRATSASLEPVWCPRTWVPPPL